MSWIQKLCETYDNCQSMVGYSTDENKRPLLPICHMTAQAHIEIVINQEGSFKRARLITDRNDATTIIPCTEASGSRSGRKPEHHPLCDQLQYVAGDFKKYGGAVTSGFSKNPDEPYLNYVKTLTAWCESKFAHPQVQAVLKYVKKKTLIKNLADSQILLIGKDGKFLPKKGRKRQKNVSDIFTVVALQEKSFIRWEVETPESLGTKLWKDKTLWESWIQYYFKIKKKEPLCFVKGEEDFLASQHPKYIRVKGDGAKLISSNDTKDFTFRGRFLTNEQACGVGLEVTQKAHNALIWLISRQGKVFFVKGDNGRKAPALTIVAWAISEKVILQPTQDSFDILLGLDELPSDEPFSVSTAQDLSLKLTKKILGYKTDLGETRGIQIMALDSATKGRLAITYYQELKGSDYFERINKWHQGCAWIHNYRYKEVIDAELNKPKRKYYTFVGAPAPSDIAEVAYGRNVDDKLKKATVARILPCIIDGQQIPRDLVESAVRHVANRIGMKDPKDKYEKKWNKTLSIACALFKKLNEKEDYSMALEEDRKTRDYLYGRLLAVADCLEGFALFVSEKKRATNAARLMQRFSDRPCSTWKTIELALAPYKIRLGGRVKKYQDVIDKVMTLFEPAENFTLDKPLTGEFLLGYHCQREALKAKKGEPANIEEDNLVEA